MNLEEAEKMCKEVFGSDIEFIREKPKEDDDGQCPQTRLEKFFGFCHSKKLVTNIYSPGIDQYEVLVTPKDRRKKIRSACGSGPTVGLALDAVWDDLKKLRII